MSREPFKFGMDSFEDITTIAAIQAERRKVGDTINETCPHPNHMVSMLTGHEYLEECDNCFRARIIASLEKK